MGKSDFNLELYGVNSGLSSSEEESAQEATLGLEATVGLEATFGLEVETSVGILLGVTNLNDDNSFWEANFSWEMEVEVKRLWLWWQ